MDLFSRITISQFIWYLVPGLGLIFFLFIPILVFNPPIARLFFEGVGLLGVIVLGIVLGFCLDGLRLYRFRPHYSTIRKTFFDNLQATISTDLDPYFIQSHINDFARSKNITGLSLHHAIWIMLGHFTMLAFLETFFWVLATLYFRFWATSTYLKTYSVFGTNVYRDSAIITCAAFAVFFLFISIRLLYISTEDQRTTNKMFENFAQQHCEEIRESLEIPPFDRNASQNPPDSVNGATQVTDS
ncbi:MAG TPA: hypothetical protein VMW89_08540 [Desulfatiglandales bacterium]|nr:hypothetical protein [Desulfatiglandales bacterium]